MHDRIRTSTNDTDQIAPIVEDSLDDDFATTSTEDVESAGRSCLVILVLAAIILIFLLAWVIFGITGGTGR